MAIPLSLSEVPAVTPYVQYVATNGQTVFPYPFPITQDSDLVVVYNGVTLATDAGYTLSGQGNDTGGNVTFTAGAKAGDIVTLYRDISIERLTQIGQNSGFSSTAFNAEFNNIYLVLQQLSADIAQCLQIPNTNNPAPTTVLTPGAYANKYLSFDSKGNPTPAVLTSSGSLTQALLADLLNPQTPTEFAKGIVPVSTVYLPGDIRRYGGDPTGVGASDAALTNAIAVLGSTGGTITLPGPNANYTFASPISLNVKSGVVLQGDGTASSGVNSGTRLTYLGTGSGVWINMDSSQGVRLKNLQLVHSNALFTGTYIRCNNDGTHGDPTQCGLDNCTVGAAVGPVLHLDLHKCINFGCNNTVFQYSGSSGSVRGAQSGGYANNNWFRGCEWFNGSAAYFQNAGPHQAWALDSCVFEGLTQASNTPAGAILSTASTGTWSGLMVSACWFGDTGTGVGTWIDGYFNGAVFTGNYISGNATGTTAVNLRASLGVVLTGNQLSTLLNGVNFATATCSNIVATGNIANSVTNPWANPSNCLVGTLSWSANFGFGVPSGHGAPISNNGIRVYADGTGSTAQGEIDQWGSSTVTSATGTITIASATGMAFPNACTNVVGSVSASANSSNVVYLTPSGINFTYVISGSMPASLTFNWQAKGN
jgi:hypothetical protein